MISDFDRFRWHPPGFDQPNREHQCPQEQASTLLALWQLMRELEPRERVQRLAQFETEYAEILDRVAREMADAA